MHFSVNANVNIVDKEFSFDIPVNESYSFQQLYDDVDSLLISKGCEPSFFTKFPLIQLNNEWHVPISSALIVDFVASNDVNLNELHLFIEYGGIGAGESIGNYYLEIRAREPISHVPHVHVSKDKRHSVSIKIADTIKGCEILAGIDIWSHFKNRDRKDILALIVKYNKEFSDFYRIPLEKYVQPSPVVFSFRGEEHVLCYNEIEAIS